MIPTAEGKLCSLILWAEREGYMHVHAELLEVLRMIGKQQPHPVPSEVRAAVSDYLQRNFPSDGSGNYPLSRRDEGVRTLGKMSE